MHYKKRLKAILFFLTMMLLLTKSVQILSPPIGTAWANQTGMNEVHKYKNQYDILFCGTSMAIANISNQFLYDQYGIAGVSIAEPEQPLYLSLYTLEDALRVQKPTAVLLDSRALFYSEAAIQKGARNRSDFILHNSIDPIKSYKVKTRALEYTKKYDPELDVWDYYSLLYNNHSNWRNLNENNFSFYDDSDCMNGNVSLYDTAEGVYNYYASDAWKPGSEIDSETENILSKMLQLCKENNADLILITSYITSSKEQHDAVSQLATKYNLPYIDINEHISELGFQYQYDLSDANHFNLNGAIKWTNYLGKYLKNQYEITDKRDIELYNRYNKQQETFNKQRGYVESRISLLNAIDFYTYITELSKLDYIDNTVFISVYDEATGSLNYETLELLKKLGLTTNFQNQWRSSYLAVITDGKVEEKLSSDETISLSDFIKGESYSITSGGLTSGNNASIKINGQEYIAKGRGFNIVVYNHALKKVVSSVYFDTCAEPNPPTRRVVVQNGVRIHQQETAPNVWENI